MVCFVIKQWFLSLNADLNSDLKDKCFGTKSVVIPLVALASCSMPASGFTCLTVSSHGSPVCTQHFMIWTHTLCSVLPTPISNHPAHISNHLAHLIFFSAVIMSSSALRYAPMIIVGCICCSRKCSATASISPAKQQAETSERELLLLPFVRLALQRPLQALQQMILNCIHFKPEGALGPIFYSSPFPTAFHSAGGKGAAERRVSDSNILHEPRNKDLHKITGCFLSYSTPSKVLQCLHFAC